MFTDSAEHITNYLALCDNVLSDINTKSKNATFDSPLNKICYTIWESIISQMKICAIICRRSPQEFVAKIIIWSLSVEDSMTIRKKFTSAFTSARSEQQTSLTLAQIRRTVAHFISINSLAVILGHLQPTDSEIPFVTEILEFIQKVIEEVHNQPLRIDVYKDLLRGLMGSLAAYNFLGVLQFVTTTINEVSKTPKFWLYIGMFSSVKIHVYPPEKLEYSLQFLEFLASYFMEAKGYKLRDSYSSTFKEMLLPLVPIVSAEVNIPKWEKVFGKLLLQKVLELWEKPKYRSMVVELVVIIICLCNKSIFYENWLRVAESICLTIREEILPSTHLNSILRLIWVYCNRFPDAFATQSQNILKICNTLEPSTTKKLHLSLNDLESFYFRLANILGPIQPQMLIRDLIVGSLLDTNDYHSTDSIPAGKVIVAVKSMLYFSLVADGESKFPEVDFDPPPTSCLFEHFLKFNPDDLAKEAWNSASLTLGKYLESVDLIIWNSTLSLMDKHQRTPQETLLLESIKIIFESSPRLVPIFKDRHFGLFKFLLRYASCNDEDISTLSTVSFIGMIDRTILSIDEITVLYWYYSKILEKLTSTDHAINNYSEIFLSLVKNYTNLLEDHIKTNKEDFAVVGDISLKCLLFTLNVSKVVRERAREALIELLRVLNDTELDLKGDLESFILAIKDTLQADILVSITDISRYTLTIRSKCPLLVSLSRSSIYTRCHDLQIQISSIDVDELTILQWSYYACSVLSFGLSDDHSSPTKKQAEGLRRFKMLNFSRSNNQIVSLKGYLGSLFDLLHLGNEYVCDCLCDAARSLNDAFLLDFFDSLTPHLDSVSEEFRNYKYQAVRRSKKSESLKVFMAKLLSRVAPKLSSNPDANWKPHASIRKFIIEAFYFCTEVDVENILPALKYHLAELVRCYHDAVFQFPQRYEFFPFKLQSELFLAIKEWFNGSHMESFSIFTTADHASLEHSFSDASVLVSTMNSSSLSMKIAMLDIQKMYADSLCSLCHGLLNPIPMYRNESAPSTQIFRWIDSLILFDTWGLSLAKRAVYNLLISNKSIIEMVIQRIFQTDIILKFPALSDAYYEASCEALLNRQVTISNPLMATLLSFKAVHGSAKVQKYTYDMVKMFFDLKVNLNTIANLSETLSSYSNQILTQCVLRFENLLDTPLDSLVNNLLCSWIGKIVIPKGSKGHEVETISNLAIISIRYHQKDSLQKSFPLWESLFIWPHHILLAVKVWVHLIIRHRSKVLLTIASEIFRYFALDPLILPLLKESFITLADPKHCLRVENHYFLSGKLFITGNDQGDIFESRINALIQNTEKSLLSIDFMSSGHIVAYLIFQINIPEMWQVPEVWHLCNTVQENDTSNHFTDFPNENFSFLGDSNELAVVALSWAIWSPLNQYSLHAWRQLSDMIPSLDVSIFYKILPIVLYYVRSFCESKRGTKTETLELIISSLEFINNIPIAEQDGLCSIVADIGLSLLRCENSLFYNTGLKMLQNVTSCGLFMPIDSCISELLLKSYSDTDSRYLILNLMEKVLTKFYQCKADIGENIAEILCVLLPSLILRVGTEEWSLLQNIVITLSRMIEARYPMMSRRLLGLCRIKARRGINVMKELAMIFSDEIFLKFTSLVINSLIVATFDHVNIPQVVKFCESWFEQVRENLEFTEKNSDIMNQLLRILITSEADGLTQSSLVDLILDSKPILLEPKGSQPVKPLRLGGSIFCSFPNFF